MMNIGIIGAGKVGFTLGKYFKTHGIQVSGYFSRSEASAQEAAAFTETVCYTSINEIIQASDALFLTVPDGAIRSCYEALPKQSIKGKLICHCSGAMSSQDAFPGIRELGAFGYSVHPLFAVSDRYRSYRELSDVFFCVEGDDEHLPELTALLEGCGNPVQVISAEAKVRYHAAAAIASNHVIALVAESLNIMTGCGFTREGALQALRPILVGNMKHAAEVGPVEGLTGPVERCDTGTVAKHLAAMPGEEERELYRLLSCQLVRVAQEKHPDRNYEPMNELLKGEPSNA